MKTLLFFFTIVIFISACSKKEINYSVNKNGLQYYYHEQADTNNPKAKRGDNLVLFLNYYDNRTDSLLFSSDYAPSKYRIKLRHPSYEGGQSIEDALGMMHIGDSMSFVIPAKDFYNKTVRRNLPYFMNDSSNVRFEIRLVDIQTEAQIKKEKEEFNNKKHTEEAEQIAEYVEETYPTAKKSSTGMYKQLVREGKGTYPQKGDYVSIHYIGKLTNGYTFIDTYKDGNVMSFTNGDIILLQGLQQGIDSMKVGEKSIFIVPSKLGFDSEQMRDIPPYSTLIFEVELFDVAKY